MIFFAPCAHAQSADDAQPPSGPLLASAPDYSQWVVTFTYPEDKNPTSGADASGPAPAYLTTRTRTITTTKTHEVIHEEFVDGRGEKFDEWHVGNIAYTKGSGSNLWGELDPSDLANGSAHFQPLPASGFRNLDWITKDSYAGTMKYSGRDCLVFTLVSPHKTNLFKLTTPESQLESLATYALIDAETRLPVIVKAEGMTRLYQFKNAPTEKLTLPPDLAEQLRKGEEGRKRLNQPMPRPY